MRTSSLLDGISLFLLFVAVGGLITATPRYITEILDRPISAVGFAMMALGFGAITGRLTSGALLRRIPASHVAVISTATATISLVATLAIQELWWFYLCRALQGFSSSAFHTSVFTRVIAQSGDMQAGRAIALTSVPLFVGTAIGPYFGEVLSDVVGVNFVWLVLTVPASMVFLISLWQLFADRKRRTENTVETPHTADSIEPIDDVQQALVASSLWSRVVSKASRLVYPRAIGPGVCWILLSSTWAGCQAFLPLYALHIGMSASGPLFLTFSLVVITLRSFGAWFFDRIPVGVLATVGGVCAVSAAALLTLYPTPLTLFVSVALLATNTALGWGALLRMATARASSKERGSAVATFNISFDVGMALSSSALGLLIHATGSYSHGFGLSWFAAVMGTIGVVLISRKRGMGVT